MAGAGGMGCGCHSADPPRPEWELQKALNVEKPKAVAECLLAGYCAWTVKGFQDDGPSNSTIDPSMDSVDQSIF